MFDFIQQLGQYRILFNQTPPSLAKTHDFWFLINISPQKKILYFLQKIVPTNVLSPVEKNFSLK